MDALNISVNIVSLILGGFAIRLSVYFYTKAKDAETESAKTLEAIKAQTEALQKLTGRWMDRLTRYATEPRPADESLMMLVSTMANLPTTLLTHFRLQASTQPPRSNEDLLSEIVDCYIGLYYYIAVVNDITQALLPSPDNFDESLPEHKNIKSLIDLSYNDFNYMAQNLSQVNQTRLDNSRVKHLYAQASNTWRPLVRNTEDSLDARRS